MGRTTMCRSENLCVPDPQNILGLLGVYQEDVQPHTNEKDKCLDVNYNLRTTGIDKLSALFEENNVKVRDETERNCNAGYYPLTLRVDAFQCHCLSSGSKDCFHNDSFPQVSKKYCTGYTINGFRPECPHNYCNLATCYTCNNKTLPI